MGHTILDRRASHSLAKLSASQIQLDSALQNFTTQASDPVALASMTAASFSFKAARLLFLEMASASKLSQIAPRFLLQGGANLFALSTEVSAFRASTYGLSKLQGQKNIPEIFNAEGWKASFLDFLCLKSAGAATQGQNIVLGHFGQANAMVFGHEVSAHLGFTPVQEGGYIEKLARAEATNMALAAGMGLMHRLHPGISHSERKMEVRRQAFMSPPPAPAIAVKSLLSSADPTALNVMRAVESSPSAGVESEVRSVPEGRINMWGEKLFKDSKSSWLKPQTWRSPMRVLQDTLLNEMLRNEAIKKRMIAFLDVVTSAPNEQIRDLLRLYFPQGGKNASGILRLALHLGTSRWPRDFMIRWGVRLGLRSMAHRFLAGETIQAAIHHSKAWRNEGIETTLDVVRENVLSAKEADLYTQTVLDLIQEWQKEENLPARTAAGIPVRHISVKLSGLTYRLDPSAYDWAVRDAGARLLKIFKAAKEANDAGKPVMVNIDLEDAYVGDLSYDIFWKTLSHPMLKDWQDAAIVLQVYDTKSEQSFQHLLEQARHHRKMIQVRFVKGAYHSFEQIRAQRQGWPIPVFMTQRETDQSFRRLARLALENHKFIRPAFGTHNLEDIAYVQALREEMGLAIESVEHQFLRGVGNHLAAAMVRNGIPARFYGPFGSQSNALGYMVRRLDEVKLNSAIGTTHLSGSWRDYRIKKQIAMELNAENFRTKDFQDFIPEPEADFSNPQLRLEMMYALEQVQQQSPRAVTPLIGDKPYSRGHTLPEIYTRPAHWSRELSQVWRAAPHDVAQAIELAQRGYEVWAFDKIATQRAQILRNAADQFSKLKYFFAALLVIEASKPWHLALAEVNEGIDFLRAYADQAHGVSQTRSALGVGVAIAPFNFPFGILIGEIAGGLAAGNAMLVKPSEQTSLIAFEAVEVLRRAGVPANTLQLLPGDGSVGEALVKSPQVDFVIFTGSVETAARISESARLHPSARHGYKLLVLETGGKNAAIVGKTADLDVAVKSVEVGAFESAGQRCSAVSRVFVDDAIADAFIQRLSEGAASMLVGDPVHAEMQVGALIDYRAFQKVNRAIEAGKRWAGRDENIHHRKDSPSRFGYFVNPWIFVGSKPQDPFVQTEHFGPLLAVMRVSNFEEGLRLANHSAYGLTAALFSRNPKEIQRFFEEIEAGNAYVNRSPTGALVGFQPFGASHPKKDSGTGPKAGGREYVVRFTTAKRLPSSQTSEIFHQTPPVSDLLGNQLSPQQKLWSKVDPETRIAWAAAIVRELQKDHGIISTGDREILIERIQRYIHEARRILHPRVTMEKRGERNEEAHDWPNGIGYIAGEGENIVDILSASVAALLMGNGIVLTEGPRTSMVKNFVYNAANAVPQLGKSKIPLLAARFPLTSLLNDRQIDFIVAHGSQANELFKHFSPRLPKRSGFRRVIGGHMDNPNEPVYLTRFSSARTRSEETLRHGAELNLR